MGRYSNARLAAFAGPGLPVAAMGLPLVAFLPPYYSGELGLNLAAVGFVFFLVRVLDVPFDPLVGHWADNTKTRWGRFKPWVAGGSIICFLAGFAVFFPPQNVSIFYLFGFLALLYGGYSALNVAHTSWGAVIGSEYHERSRVFSFWNGGHLLGLVLVLLMPAILHAVMGDAAPPAVQTMGLFFLILLPTTVLGALFLVPRSNTRVDQEKLTFAEVRRAAAQPELRAIVLSDLIFNLGAGALVSLMRFFLEQSRGFTDDESSLMLLALVGSGFFALPLWLALSRRIGKGRTAGIACFTQVALHFSIYPFLGGHDVALGVGLYFIAGLPVAAPAFLMRAMLADYAGDERESGRPDRVGLLNALLTTAQKIGYALPVGIFLPILSFVGFSNRPGAENGPEAIMWLEMIYLISLPLGLIPAGIILFKVSADRRRHLGSQADSRPSL